MSDIRKFAVEETGVLHLRGADDELLMGEDKEPLTITIYGPGSKPHARAQTAQQNRLMNRVRRKGKTEQTDEQRLREQAEFLSACTKEFSSNIEYDGLSGDELFRAVYEDVSIGFIADQVAKHLGDWGNFTKGSPKS